MGKWIWPEGLAPLWEDDITDKEKAYKQGRELEEAIAKYYAEHGGGDRIINDPESLAELDEREMENARSVASDYMARNRVSLIDKFMESDLAKQALGNGEKAEDIRKWAGKLLGLGKLKPSAIENAVAKSLRGDGRNILDSFPMEAKRALYSLAEREVLRKKELNPLNGIKSRDLQGYRKEHAIDPIEDWEIRNEMRQLEALLLSNMSRGKGAVVPVYGSGGTTVEIPGLEGVNMSSMDDKVLLHMLDSFRTSGFLPEVQDTDRTDGLDPVRSTDKVFGAVTGKAGKVLRDKAPPDDSGVIETALYGPDKKPLKEYVRDVAKQWLDDPVYRKAHDAYFSKSNRALPDDWELGYPFAIYGLNGSSDLIVFDKEGSPPRSVAEEDRDYEKFKRFVYVPGKGQNKKKDSQVGQELPVGMLEEIVSKREAVDESNALLEKWKQDPVYRAAWEAYDGEQAPLPEGWEKGFPFAIWYPDSRKDRMIVFEGAGSLPHIVERGEPEYEKFKPYVYMAKTVSDSRMKKRKRRGMTHVGKIGAALTDDVFRFWG